MTEERYTLTEASRILREDQCTQEGHSVLWIPIRNEERELPDPTYSCIRCDRYCTTRWTLEANTLFSGFADARILALREHCKRSSSGHEMLPVPPMRGIAPEGYEFYVCARCDVWIEFLKDLP